MHFCACSIYFVILIGANTVSSIKKWGFAGDISTIVRVQIPTGPLEQPPVISAAVQLFSFSEELVFVEVADVLESRFDQLAGFLF